MADSAKSASTTPRRATVVLASVADFDAEPLAQEVEIPGSARFLVPQDSLWKARAVVPGFWSPEVLVGPTGESLAERPLESGSSELVLHPATVVGGVFTTRAQSLPDQVSVSFSASESANRKAPEVPATGLAGKVRCPVDDEGGWRCLLPVGRHDLHFKAPGFASVFEWDVVARKGDALTIGPHRLHPGASLFGFVKGDALETPAEVEVRLSPASLHPSPSTRHWKELVRDTHPDRRGFFQFRDLAAGSYVVSVRRPDGSILELKPISIPAGLEVDLGAPIVLRTPSRLVVHLDPPTSTYGAPWQVQLVPRDQRLPPRDGDTDPLGTWSQAVPAPGRYRLLIGGPDGERWWARDVDLEGRHRVLHVQIPQIPVRGVLTRGGDPVRARITFTDPEGQRSVLLYSDSEGRYHGSLPETGTWMVSLLYTAGGARQELHPVVIEPPDGEPIRLDLRAPATHLVGTVRDESGQPVAGARVLAWSPGTSRHGSKVDTDQQGRFEFLGLSPADYVITAFRGARGGSQDVTLIESAEPQDIRIELIGTKSWGGRVISEHGPVPGAEVWIRAELATPRQLPYGKATAGPLGEFRAEVPADSRWLDIVVLAYGRSARILRVPPETSPRILLDEIGGSLALRIEADAMQRARLGFGQGWIHVAPLRSWARAHGLPMADDADLVLPAMAPGAYSLCSDADGESCDQAFLAPDDVAWLNVIPPP